MDPDTELSWSELFIRTKLAVGKAELQAALQSPHCVWMPWLRTNRKEDWIWEGLVKVEQEKFPKDGPVMMNWAHSVELHVLQDEMEVLPTKAWKVPVGHGLQEEAPILPWYVPFGHFKHAEAPANEYCPSEQSKHSDDPQCENFPAEHVPHTVEDGWEEYVPGSQALQVLELLLST
jgi:hypothetical protein